MHNLPLSYATLWGFAHRLPARQSPEGELHRRSAGENIHEMAFKEFSMHPILIAALILCLPLTAMAEGETTGAMAGHDMTKMDGTATPEYQAAMSTMMTDMMVPYTGNADADFVRSMIPHHQGAIDMAKVVLEYGQDPDVRKLAEGVIAAQEGEIAWMTDWLAKHGQ
jgi:uncharacterized protein (DUF305 family)